MTKFTKKIIPLALGVMTAFNASAFAGERVSQPELSDNALETLNYYGVNPGHITFDKVRDRDRVGSNYCEDENKDGIADVSSDGYLYQDQYRFSSTITDADGQKQFMVRQSRGEFIAEMEKHENATGVLVRPEEKSLGWDQFVALFVVRENGETKIARVSSRQPLGDMPLFKSCDSLTIPEGAQKEPASNQRWSQKMTPF